MKGPAPLHDVVDEIRDALDRIGAPYAVKGDIAASYWGLPNFTGELEVAIGAVSNAGDVLRALREAGHAASAATEAAWRDQPAERRTLVLTESAAGPVWLVDDSLDDSDFLRSVLTRRIFVELAGRRTPLITPEDLVLFKLVAWRPKDQAHLDDLLLVVGQLDDAYLVGWADRLGVRDRLEEQWRRSGRELRA